MTVPVDMSRARSFWARFLRTLAYNIIGMLAAVLTNEVALQEMGVDAKWAAIVGLGFGALFAAIDKAVRYSAADDGQVEGEGV